MTQQIDTDTLSTEELTKLANEELGQARDDQGRFVAQDAATTQDQGTVANGEIKDDAEEVDEIVYRRIIDLGDGSGTQVFEAPSMEELVDKLATAQEHATRKIRELANPKKATQESELDENEEFVLSQMNINSPTKGFREQFKRNFGITIEEFKQQQTELAGELKARRDERLGRDFAQSHPEFKEFYTEKNGLRVEKWLRLEGLEFNNENVEKAFVELTESGLLEPIAQNQDAEPKTSAADAPRIAESTTRIVGQRRAASGLSSQGGKIVTKAAEPTLDELYSMSYEELAKRANSTT